MFPIFYLKIMFPVYIAEVIFECFITLRIFSCIRGKYIKCNTTFVMPTSILEGSTSHNLKYSGVYKGKLIIKIKFANAKKNQLLIFARFFVFLGSCKRGIL